MQEPVSRTYRNASRRSPEHKRAYRGLGARVLPLIVRELDLEHGILVLFDIQSILPKTNPMIDADAAIAAAKELPMRMRIFLLRK